MYINGTTTDGANVLNYLSVITNQFSTPRGYIIVESNTNGDNTYAIFSVSSISTTGEVAYTVTYSSGTLPSNNEVCVISFTRTGDSGTSGLSGTSGASGTSGRSGISGLSGLSGTSGRSGISGLSGTGASGISGISGLSGTGGSGISGISGNGVSGISGLLGGGCTTDVTLVSSHSGSFQQSSYTSGDFFFGGDKFGWNEAPWNIQYNTTAKIDVANSFIAVPLPRTLVSGDTIKVCGILVNSTSSNTKEYGAAISYITCDDQDGSGNYYQTNLAYDNSLGTFDSFNTGCFTLEHTLTSGLDACTDLILIGLNADIGDVNNETRFSYSCSVTHTC